MPQLLCDRDYIGVVGDQDACYGMTESVWIDMRQSMPFAELCQPCGDTVRMHGAAVIPGKHETGIPPSVAVELAELLLFCLILAQQ